MFRTAGRVVKWLLLLTLPITIFPIFSAVFGGITFSIWRQRQIDANVDKFLNEIKNSMNDWGVGGGAPSFREFEDTHNDFHLMRINSNDWTAKMGFLLPEEYTSVESVDVSIDTYASLTTLMRDMSCPDTAKMPKEQWVWLAWYGFPQFDVQWDGAFNHALQYVHAHSNLNESGLFYAQCSGTAGFLCGVWSTRPPALIHFLVEDEPLDDAGGDETLTYSSPRDKLLPVTARIIEFPLQDAYTGLSPNQFSGYKEQILSIIAGDRLYEQFDPYDAVQQTFSHFDEYVNKLWDEKGSLLNRVNKMDDWMIDHVNKPLGIEDTVVFMHSFLFLLAAGATEGLVLLPARVVSQTVGEFLGRPKRGDWILGNLGDKPQEPANIMDDIFGDFWASLGENIAKHQSSMTEESEPVIT
ncbi:hypothetical protein DOTSEDRAFT_69788 [Dothistroma septosporum NZE10]|uniref:Uncharacterized protein n=1 Tax=Dothistroma septosporum (strain NZE10 / CBS 128990) TaxID=675120 RepID=N1PWQ3_DOTSN|nr:hypothetical protein DOTSEDRAFT_69788 [Dothistroma septosporum NZE10]